ncbi:MAG: type III secretion system inner membrane ring subunit SctD, partial [Deltaproteobacteria bacterium]|nr:type III secretion system inner membrane ring subunit SctD [Deltaproteobacteria bacterium]
MNDGILLGIFTGNHAGAEAPFEVGEHTLGSGLECDVALTDRSLASRHCSFSLAKDGAVRISPLEGTLTLDGQSLPGPLDWPARAPVLAGMVCLAWKRPGQSWAGMKLPSLLTAEEKPAPSSSPSAETMPENRIYAMKLETIPAPGSSPKTAAPNTSKTGVKRPWRIGRLALIATVLLGLAGLTISLSPLNNKGNRAAMLERALQAQGLSSLWVEENAGRVMVYGLAPTEADANKVRGIAAAQPFPVQVTVREREEFIRAILAALAGHGIFPQVRIEAGEAFLAGYVLDSLTENAAVSWARGSVPRVASISSALLTRGMVETTLTEELTKAGLRGKSSVDWRPGVIALSGDAANKTALAGVIEAVRGKLGSPIAFKLVIASEPERIYVGNGASANQNLPPSRDQASGQG